MKLLIEIPDNYKQRLDEDFDNLNTGSIGCTAILMAVKEGTPIPNNATNGDMIKVMFPSDKGELKDNNDKVLAYILDDLFMLYLSDYWWNKPYERGE